MTRTSLTLLLALVASLGIIVGLSVHLSRQWHTQRSMHLETAAGSSRFPSARFVEGECADGLRLRPSALQQHVAILAPELTLSDPQQRLIEDLILSRAETLCAVRAARAALRREPRPLQSVETARPFLEAVLALRQTLTEATLAETQTQAQLLASLSDAQLSAVPPDRLLQIIPGLSAPDRLVPVGRGFHRRPSQR